MLACHSAAHAFKKQACDGRLQLEKKLELILCTSSFSQCLTFRFLGPLFVCLFVCLSVCFITVFCGELQKKELSEKTVVKGERQIVENKV